MDLRNFKVTKKSVKLGERLEFEFVVRSNAKTAQKLVIDYVVHFVKANRKTAPKVFKLKTVTVPAGSEIEVTKSHHLKPITTRVYYGGAHRLEIQINGSVRGAIPWTLVL